MQISVAEGLEDFDDDLAKGVGNILREGPPGGRQQPVRQRTGAEQLAVFQRGQNIHVLHGPDHQPQGDER